MFNSRLVVAVIAVVVMILISVLAVYFGRWRKLHVNRVHAAELRGKAQEGELDVCAESDEQMRKADQIDPDLPSNRHRAGDRPTDDGNAKVDNAQDHNAQADGAHLDGAHLDSTDGARTDRADNADPRR